MTVCVTTNTLDYRSIYPVLDPRRTAGPGPYMYAYGLAWDGVQINVARSPLLTSCQMRVNFVDSTNLSEDKEIQAWNLFNNDFVDRVGSAHLGLATTMPIRRTSTCGAGADTVVLCRYFAWPRGRTALYTFWPDDFWDFWGGCIVTFDWQTDTRGSGRWGNQTPQPTYPLVRKPDFTLMRDAAGTGFMVVFGGAGFAADPTYLGAMGFNMGAAVPFSPLPSTPADGTVVREMNRMDMFVVYGGAKFKIPDLATLFTLGFDTSKVRVIPPGGTSQLLTVPIDGTLIKEQHTANVFLVDKGALRWVKTPAAMDRNCLPWRHIRTVPDTSLAALPHGPDLT